MEKIVVVLYWLGCHVYFNRNTRFNFKLASCYDLCSYFFHVLKKSIVIENIENEVQKAI